MKAPVLRPGRDSDGPALIALVWACWSAHPGIRLDVDNEMPEFHALATYYAGQGGTLWVAETDTAIVGMVATRPASPETWEICRLYTDPTLHGAGLGHLLLDQAEHYAIAAGARRLQLHSDTRFDRAHAFYEKRSYIRFGPVRILNDISNSLEFGYAKPVSGALVLDIAAATSANRRLVEILIACVAAGASTSFLPPLAPDAARAFWQRVASDIGNGRRSLVAAWQDGALQGTGTLDRATPQNQPHRAEVQNILVHPQARRRGLARQIMRALEAEAIAHGKSLLTLDTIAGEVGEALFRSEQWQEAGRIPGYVLDTEGAARPMVLFWKHLPGTPPPE